MYESYWKLRFSPFRGCLDTSLFYQSSLHEEALARLQFLVEQRRRLGLLLGPCGCGKSMLVKVFAGELERSGAQVVQINLLGVDAYEFIWTLSDRLGLNPTTQAPSFQLWRMVNDRLAENRFQQVPTVVLLDDADEAEAEVLCCVTRLAQSESSPEARLTIVLCADILRMVLIGARLIELSELRVELDSWEEADTADFVNTSINKAGGQASVFTPMALVRLHHLSDGIPRRVIQLADLALLAGAGAQLNDIDTDTIEAVHMELGVHLATTEST